MDATSEKEIDEYVIQKTKIRNRPPHNSNFLRKFNVFAKTIQPIMAAGVDDRLNQFWKNGRIQGVATNRTYDSIFRIAQAQARLNLSDEVTDDIATQAMDSISLMLSQYGKVVQTIQSPRNVTYDMFVNVLKQTKSGILITQLCRIACEENKQVSEYVGEKWDVQHNRKLRTVIKMLLNHTKIKLIKAKPLVLQYFDEVTSDAYDIYDTTIKASQNNVAQSTTDLSDIYDRQRLTPINWPKLRLMNKIIGHLTHMTYLTQLQTCSLTQSRNHAISSDLEDLILGLVNGVDRKVIYTT